MSFRARLFLALALAALLPLGVLAFGVRREMTRRLTAENARRGDAAVAALRDDLARESDAIAARLATLTAELEPGQRSSAGAGAGRRRRPARAARSRGRRDAELPASTCCSSRTAPAGS